MIKMKALQNKIGYSFKNKNYLIEAMTHSSFANERDSGMRCNERMEFLGDAVLSIISAQLLFEKYPDMPEGELSKLRSSLVCTESLSDFARQIDLGNALLLGKGEANTGGHDRPSILENAFEALIAAVYLDGGMEAARKFVLGFLNKALENHQINFKDYKTILQEVVQKNPGENVNYVLVDEIGPDHNKEFVMEVHLNSNVIGTGRGKSKKSAEQAAAKEALELMGI